MIVYQLICDKTHEFEAWFRDSSTFDMQHLAGDVECPQCGSVDIHKAIMSPHISTGNSTGKRAAPDPQKSTTLVRTDQSEVRAREVAAKILDAVKTIRESVEENCEYVGREFPEEARRIHYGDAEERGIYGEATEIEVRELTDEGVDLIRLPDTARKDN